MFKIIPILMGVVISYAVAMIMNACGIKNPDGSAILNFASIASSGWVGLPGFQLCKFDVTAVLVMAPIAIATMMEHVGDMSAISATVISLQNRDFTELCLEMVLQRLCPVCLVVRQIPLMEKIQEYSN